MVTQRVGRAAQRAYTLVELMTVVAVVGVLATLSVFGVRKYIYASKSSEAMSMINSIRAHQETYKDETYAYLPISTDLNTLYPMPDPSGRKWAWWNPSGNNYANWRTLGADASGPVAFGYACIAGAAGATVSNPPGVTQNLSFPSPAVEPWYVIRAVGDQNNDNVNSILVGSSFTNEIHVQNDGE